MKKILLSIVAVAAAACGSYSAAADTFYEITFGKSTKDLTSVVSADNFINGAVDNGTNYITSVTTCNYIYLKNGYVQMAKSGNNGMLELSLSDAGKVKATKLEVEAAGLNNKEVTLSVNGKSSDIFTSKTTLTYTLDGTADITSLKFEAISKKQVQLYGIKVYYADNGGSTDPVAPGYKWMLGEQEVEDATVTIDANDNVFPTLDNPNNVTVTYSIEPDNEVASIDATTGEITLINEGTAMVYAKSEATDKYLAGEAAYMLTVNPKVVETKCATPTFSHGTGVVAKGTEVTVSTTTEGAKLMLMINEEAVESETNTYIFTVNETTSVSAWAEKEGLDDSDIAEAVYTVNDQGGDDPVEGTTTFKASTATFDSECMSFANNASGKLGDTQFVSGPITLSITKDNPDYEIYDAGNHVRWYTNNFITLTPAKNYKITEVYVKTVSNSRGNFTATVNGEDAGTVSGTGAGASNPITWTGSVTAPLLLTPNAQIRFSYMTVKYKEDTSGIEDATTADENAPVEYYNLQGIRVNNPENGVYIRRQGNTVTKVLVK